MLARAANDPAWLVGALADVAELYAHAGRVEEAKDLCADVMSYPGVVRTETVYLAWVAEWLDLEAAEIKTLSGRRGSEFWRRMCELMLAGEFNKVADIAAKMPWKDREALARVRAARAFLARRQPHAAAAQVEQALAFFRSVGATRYIREAEELEAAISREQEEVAQPQA